jgi:hypothetical protein
MFGAISQLGVVFSAVWREARSSRYRDPRLINTIALLAVVKAGSALRLSILMTTSELLTQTRSRSFSLKKLFRENLQRGPMSGVHLVRALDDRSGMHWVPCNRDR